MAITLNQTATHAKDMIREPISDTISVALMEEYVRQTYTDWCQEMAWPEGTLTQPSVAGTQEYSLPDTLNIIHRVYINGQRAVPTTIALMEGDARGVYDPSWRVLPAATIPSLTSGVNQAIPITQGTNIARVMYYTRGGYIGFVPIPAAIYTISIEAAVYPPSPASGDTLVFPDQFKDGLAFGAIKRFMLGDRRKDEAEGWRVLEDEQFKNGMRWRRRMASAGSDNLPLITPHDYRGWYARHSR